VSANYSQFVSTRGDNEVQVILTATFAGSAVTHGRVSRLFSEVLKEQAETLGLQASAAMGIEQEDHDQGLRTAMTEALANVTDPVQRQKLTERFGLTEESLPQSRAWTVR
jgi:hypothetical protein